MALEDPTCTLAPYFLVADGKLDEFKALGDEMVEKTRSEEGVYFYGFSFNGQRAFCREAYRSAEALLAHLENVDAPLQKVLAIASIERLEIHAPAAEIEKLREPLAGLNPEFFTVENGFRA